MRKIDERVRDLRVLLLLLRGPRRLLDKAEKGYPITNPFVMDSALG